MTTCTILISIGYLWLMFMIMLGLILDQWGGGVVWGIKASSPSKQFLLGSSSDYHDIYLHTFFLSIIFNKNSRIFL